MALAKYSAKALKTKTLKQSLRFFCYCNPFGSRLPAFFRIRDHLALRPRLTAGLPLSIGIPNCQLKHSISLAIFQVAH